MLHVCNYLELKVERKRQQYSRKKSIKCLINFCVGTKTIRKLNNQILFLSKWKLLIISIWLKQKWQCGWSSDFKECKQWLRWKNGHSQQWNKSFFLYNDHDRDNTIRIHTLLNIVRTKWEKANLNHNSLKWHQFKYHIDTFFFH